MPSPPCPTPRPRAPHRPMGTPPLLPCFSDSCTLLQVDHPCRARAHPLCFCFSTLYLRFLSQLRRIPESGRRLPIKLGIESDYLHLFFLFSFSPPPLLHSCMMPLSPARSSKVLVLIFLRLPRRGSTVAVTRISTRSRHLTNRPHDQVNNRKDVWVGTSGWATPM